MTAKLDSFMNDNASLEERDLLEAVTNQFPQHELPPGAAGRRKYLKHVFLAALIRVRKMVVEAGEAMRTAEVLMMAVFELGDDVTDMVSAVCKYKCTSRLPPFFPFRTHLVCL